MRSETAMRMRRAERKVTKNWSLGPPLLRCWNTGKEPAKEPDKGAASKVGK